MKVIKDNEKKTLKIPTPTVWKDGEPDTVDIIDSSVDLSLDFEDAFSVGASADNIRVDSAADGLVYSLVNLGRVDIEYISQISGVAMPDVIAELEGSIYQNPEVWNGEPYSGWETADEYLSGNLVRKWKKAKYASIAYNGKFKNNLAAIERVLPAPIPAKSIFVTIGSPWVPADIYDEFIEHLLGKCRFAYGPMCEVKHDESTGTWEIPFKSRYGANAFSYSTYGTPRMEALHILERTLNLKSVSVTDEVPCDTNKSGVKRVLNRAETAAAMEKQKLMIAEFRKWIWTDKDRRERLVEIFEDKYGSYRKRNYDGSFLTFPTLDRNHALYAYQKDAVARILFSPNTLLAHDVGAGKTYIMIVAGMELRRMGLSQKNLYVVPNNIIGQWTKIFNDLYPTANVLVVEPKTFTADKRNAVLEKIRRNTFDAIIMAHSCFDMIPLSKKHRLEVLRERKAEVKKALSDHSRATSALRKELDKLTKEIRKLDGEDAAALVCFDKLGIDRLFVDEAHHYKNVPIQTKIDRVLGISAAGSKKCAGMLEKVRFVQRGHNGGGVVMATGTPITNSVSDAFIFQQYLQSGELELLDLNCFDAWVGMFAERTTEFEIDVDTNSYRLATRFAKFHNLTELTALLASIADFHKVENENGLPKLDGYTDAVVPKTPAFADYLKTISARADAVRHGKVKRVDDNMLKITGDGRRAALDIRLVDGEQPFDVQCKAVRCAQAVADMYKKTAENNSTQIVFCDTSTPKDGFNMYDEVKRLLVGMGVKREHIAFIHDADTEKKRETMFAAVRAGKIRVLMGSTFKLGIGVNVQDKLIAIHHLDVPWRPADMVQREGRIIRPGNNNKNVYIYRYITEGSFDAYSWQLLETKQRFISALLSGSYGSRSGAEIDGTALGYAEVKALAIGNPLIKKRVELFNELMRLSSLQVKNAENRERLNAQYIEMPDRIQKVERDMEKLKDDIAFAAVHPPVENKDARKAIRERIYKAIKEHEYMPNERDEMDYRGFRIVIPSEMPKTKPCVYVRRRGNYYTEIGGAESGVLIRIDNCIDALPARLKRAETAYSELNAQRERLKTELDKEYSYADDINDLKIEINEIDKKLTNKS